MSVKRSIGGPGPEVREPLFHAILRRIGDLHDRKQKDYGSDEDPLANVRAAKLLGLDPVVGVVIRMGDKMHRLRTAVKKALDRPLDPDPFKVRLGKVLANEGFKDSLMDMAVYSIIALVLLEEEGETVDPILGEAPDGVTAQDIVDAAERPGQTSYYIAPERDSGRWRTLWVGEGSGSRSGSRFTLEKLGDTGWRDSPLLGPFADQDAATLAVVVMNSGGSV